VPPATFILAEELTMAAPSSLVLLILFLAFAAAVGMFWWLITRESSNRRMQAIQEWARGARFRILPRGHQPAPLPLEALGAPPRVLECLTSERCTLVRCNLPPANAVDAVSPATATPTPPRQWHLLIWPIPGNWPAAALRPAHATRSLCDLLTLPAQLSEGTQRFTICCGDRSIARLLGRSSARGLLPPDIGLLLLGRHLLLDFSERPFDAIEFNRMIAVAEQVKAHLPPV
jgi:hypothetical protein